MALETGTFISDLVATNPTGSDALAFADDHLRLIKSTVKATFPNISGAVTKTHTEINTAVDQAGAALPRAGGTMTGPIVLAGAPTVDLNPATKKYVDDANTAAAAAVRPIATGGTGAATAAAARTNLGLVIGTDVLAPNGSGASLTNLNASSLATGTVPVTRSGSLKLISKQNVYSGSPSNGSTISVSLPTALFGGNTPSFVMFSASARISGVTDLRYFFMCAGTDTIDNIVLGSASDDTDQNGTGRADAASTFVLPYSASQNFVVNLYGADLRINVIGYQV
jgi:hypothetical protein